VSTVRVEVAERIAVPVDLCRRHFFDMAHHQAHRVHAGARFVVLEQGQRWCRYQQRTRFLGATLTDTAVLRHLDDGSLENTVISGASEGLVVRFEFVAVDDGLTRVTLRASWTLRGLKRVMAPLLRLSLRRGFARALLEDRDDLEAGRYPTA
jgi:hypothetical protein